MLIAGFGVLLGVVLLGELFVVVFQFSTPPDAFYIGSVTAAPLILFLVYGGYWLRESELPPERHDRIGRWFVGGIVWSVLLIFTINATLRPVTAKMAVGTLRWSGAIGGSLGFVLGVFQARAIQRALETERLQLSKRQVERERDRLDDFASTVSHDLQNPLHVAMGRLELARLESDTDHLEDVAWALEQMEALIENLLLLAREETVVEQPESVALDETVRVCWNAIDPGQATLVVETTTRIRADRRRLRQLIENLFRNTLEGARPGVTVSVGDLPRGFYVAADRPTVPSDERGAVFDDVYSAAEHGTGFALAVAGTIADAHGWDIAVSEGADGGTRFEVTGVETADR